MLSTKALYLIYFTTGFTVGFGHCIGMCGPIVVSFSLSSKGKSIVTTHLLYNLGRIITYSILGGLMGLTGSFTIVTANIAGLQKGVLIFAGVLIVVMGVAMSGWLPAGRIFGDNYDPSGILSRGFRKLSGRQSPITYFGLGLLLGLLPCGPVYTALIGAARAGMETANPAEGILAGMGLMLAFGLGTVPALMLVARLAAMGWLKSRQVIYKTGAVLMILVGVYFIIQAIRY
jgi:sulfite exporter TauE/SafE